MRAGIRSVVATVALAIVLFPVGVLDARQGPAGDGEIRQVTLVDTVQTSLTLLLRGAKGQIPVSMYFSVLRG
jgi:hypothetical protein